MRRSHMAPIVFALLLLVTTVASAVTVVTTEGGLALEAIGYPNDVVRLTAKPGDKWTYQPDGIILPDAVALQATKGASDAQWSIPHGKCMLTISMAPPHVRFEFSCHGSSLVEVTAFADAMAAPEVNFTFPAAQTMYGLAEHAADLPLRGGNVYEMYNTDTFQYSVNSTEALYGVIPFIMAYAPKSTCGVLFLNPSETNVGVSADSAAPSCQWKPEVGAIDIFFLPGPTPTKVQQQHAALTGATVMPPYFSLGLHQCRWNYLNTKDCLSVDEGFDTHNMPYDVLWLDIEHTDKKKYFTWDPYTFPDPKALTDALASKGRKLVTVRDPHVKRDEGYYVHNEAQKGGYYVKDASGEDYVGKCWPGSSSWPDFFNTRTRVWYSQFFHDDRYPGGSRDIHTWVDMNEPSVFGGERGTMPKTAVHSLDNGHTVEHRFVHNAYSFYSVQAVHKGMLEAGGPNTAPERPFILTRSFFSGSQRYAAMWTGDNMARWDHLENSIPELLSLSISNYPFCGCDIGGFFFDPEEELFVRWMQAGVFVPFYRAHSHLDTKRREPWTFSAEAQSLVRSALALRYAMLPYLYTTFYHAHTEGNTIMRPLFYEFPRQSELREVQNTYLFGPSILVRPVVKPSVTEVTVPLPKEALWYNYFSGELAVGQHTMPVDKDTIPMFLRGGHIVPMKLRLRRSSFAARLDPFTLFVALNAQGNSYGDLYIDDGTTYDYKKGAFVHRAFSYSNQVLQNSAYPNSPGTSGLYNAVNAVERVVIYGYVGKVSKAVLNTRVDETEVATPLEFEQLGQTVVVRKPSVLVAADWIISFENE
ncbi:GANAB / alpha glucosidase II subunit [Leishmania donovani]|uniref:Glucosidase II subunit alpha n=4 Tax=Leishmania donovani species complex TaxID=38574 RepID=A4HXN5_LEIIN|nr:putative alpha glucosidase II subunit [Leishmania infantum JPCM5]XP_003860023.1 alpha glucosidase II subunit, putative [Leishmania donovani]CAC9479502.1 alpha_glucosidase_II_subunit_-_putative [Leishmania infantum]AYU77935.1 alpha glucosidase II subunit, putative [Leishmania donovani]CAJ1987952.1 GANAB / alpha glucosidase II subunit [Leishmania donovani]CAM67062.1 putative alpha glucosidase II subunit [Leishmania infantum JPCM5]CBZ33316.1 alpha glucosidase II subunit, putative [Leishmania |eukprot:XP_001464826.1 putative alpha glucosidase II subunit [Leishmania infantum JPCM5]